LRSPAKYVASNRFLQPTPTGELLNLPMSLQLTESFRVLGVDF
jgi:hypothetical protein